MQIDINQSNMHILDVFSSATRMAIIELLNTNPMNIKEMAKALGLSSAIMTKHVQKLEGAGLVKCESQAGKRGMQKICSLAVDSVTLRLRTSTRSHDFYIHDIPVGQYTAYNVRPTCGLASATGIIGMNDDPRYFADPAHTQAELIWFGSGWVEYRIPNYLLSSQTAKTLELSLEICSEAPAYNENQPSDIGFRINGKLLGIWTSPGDFGARHGILTPEWWNGGTQYGLLKTLRIDETGSCIDGVRLSGIGIKELGITYGSEITFRLENDEKARHAGGINLFGKCFGNYAQDIRVMLGH
jgi:predicted transcriptional regulator